MGEITAKKAEPEIIKYPPVSAEQISPFAGRTFPTEEIIRRPTFWERWIPTDLWNAYVKTKRFLVGVYFFGKALIEGTVEEIKNNPIELAPMYSFVDAAKMLDDMRIKGYTPENVGLYGFFTLMGALDIPSFGKVSMLKKVLKEGFEEFGKMVIKYGGIGGTIKYFAEAGLKEVAERAGAKFVRASEVFLTVRGKKLSLEEAERLLKQGIKELGGEEAFRRTLGRAKSKSTIRGVKLPPEERKALELYELSDGIRRTKDGFYHAGYKFVEELGFLEKLKMGVEITVKDMEKFLKESKVFEEAVGGIKEVRHAGYEVGGHTLIEITDKSGRKYLAFVSTPGESPSAIAENVTNYFDVVYSKAKTIKIDDHAITMVPFSEKPKWPIAKTEATQLSGTKLSGDALLKKVKEVEQITSRVGVEIKDVYEPSTGKFVYKVTYGKGFYVATADKKMAEYYVPEGMAKFGLLPTKDPPLEISLPSPVDGSNVLYLYPTGTKTVTKY
ncbi:MAG: hypothetical protein QXG98_00730 [Candidatus Micrarchaeia archaeon]